MTYSRFTRNVPFRVSNNGVKLTAHSHVVSMGRMGNALPIFPPISVKAMCVEYSNPHL